MVVPSNYVGAAVAYVSEQLGSAHVPLRRIGEDAVRPLAVTPQARKSLTVLVVGESARAQNFGLLGYDRDTTPQLSKEAGLVAFSDVHSCGTETAVSVPCMFSTFTRKQYDASKARNQEGLLDVLQRAGIAVHWRDNQSGCKGTCDRVAFEDRFTPVCRSNALDKCDRQSIINGYDNTLVYTDHVLATLIDVLRSRQDKVDTAMLYLSDHGESLGEYNLFLHGTPYMLAPEQQKHIPMLAWFSDGYRKDYAVDTDCL
uniref:Sulfatase domain-containing protein n=1 Tax=Steinernema glaseri TaxID=37863 RepID=A0A1I7Y9C7_9BILA